MMFQIVAKKKGVEQKLEPPFATEEAAQFHARLLRRSFEFVQGAQEIELEIRPI